jgi:hypothetical protein
VRRIRHTLAAIAHWKPDNNSAANGLARVRKVRLSARVARGITSDAYSDRPNDLLRDLAREVRDRAFLSLLYSLYDEKTRAEQERMRTRAGIRQRHARTLDEKFLAANAGRYASLRDALLEEARLRKLNLPESMLRDHCHIFKKFFDWSSNARLKSLLAQSDAAFCERIYSFASELAVEASFLARDIKFNWKRFRYAGFEWEDCMRFMNEKTRSLETLGLDRNADQEAIRKKYIELAKRHHPDRGGEPARMREINAAYAFLTHSDNDESAF